MQPPARLHNFHGTKRQLLGPRGVQPAWKGSLTNQGPVGAKSEAAGSRIFLSRLPSDVGEKEVEVRGF